MNTPICDFVQRYAEQNELRLHMPGHKGVGPLGIEALDITEIEGADSLYEAQGIIRESERNASELFGADTFYSTEGSSQCIRAMLWLALLYAKEQGRRPLVVAGRNAHKTFLSGVALLGMDVCWLWPENGEGYLSCSISAETVECMLVQMEALPAALYLTSPDYLGNQVDIGAVADVCRKYGVLLLVDNAHGAYLKFLPQSCHPVDLGADLCCDSGHKTLPVLTGGAYLHVSKRAPGLMNERAKQALALFGSTSPSYLILQSLDGANRYIAEGYREKLSEFAKRMEKTRTRLSNKGYVFAGSETLKLTVKAKEYGYRGEELAALLRENRISVEFCDPDHVVMMLTPEVGEEGLEKLEKAMGAIPRRPPVSDCPPELKRPERVMPVREAAMSPAEEIPVSESVGRVLAVTTVGCPPAVPIVVCGERIDESALSCFDYYGISTCTVVKEKSQTV